MDPVSWRSVTKIDFLVISKSFNLVMTTNKVFESRKISALKRSRTRLVRQLAYEIYQHRMQEGLPGDASSDWYQAEIELEIIAGIPNPSLRHDPAILQGPVSG